jgi:hypothetical protein
MATKKASKSSAASTQRPNAAEVATGNAPKSGAGSVPEAPTRVTLVPDDGLTDEQRKAVAESNSPEAIENRNKSYALPVEGVNQNTAE